MIASEMRVSVSRAGEDETIREGRTSRWAARRALNALCTSRARFGGRLSLRLRPRFEDIAVRTGRAGERV